MPAPDLKLPQLSRRMLSAKAEQFTESVIREMTRLALKNGAVNLSQGFPDFAAPQEIKEAARKAISDDINQYAITWGAKPLRDAIVEKFERTQGVKYEDRKSTRLNSSHGYISYAVFCLKKKKKEIHPSLPSSKHRSFSTRTCTRASSPIHHSTHADFPSLSSSIAFRLSELPCAVIPASR